MLASIGVALCADPFPPPAEGPLAFRRDQIPLDPESMANMSHQLEALARSRNLVTARDRRGTAQMLALAIALDPANSAARELVAEYQKPYPSPAAIDGTQRDQPSTQRDQPSTQLAQWCAWLDRPEAGHHGNALAACLHDILADPQNPQPHEAGAWDGWVPNISAYQAQELAKPPSSQSPAADRPARQEIPLSAAEVQILLWQKTGDFDAIHWALVPAPLQMTAIKMANDDRGQAPPLTIAIGSNPHAGTFAKTRETLNLLIKSQHNPLPSGYQILINSPQLERSLQAPKTQSLSAAAAVLASAAVTGRIPEAIILGQIDESGAFLLPTDLWEQLQALGNGHGQRLVLPTAAATYLPSLLATGKPEFFLEYEVLLAANFQQLLDASSKDPTPALEKTTGQFREVRDRAGNQDIHQYLSNRFVRQRLAEMAQQVPSHASARMLLMQATGARPQLVPRAVLAAELRRAIEPMAWISRPAAYASPANSPPQQDYPRRLLSAADSANLATTIERCHTSVEALDRLATKNEHDLIDQTRNLISSLRSLERATRRRDDFYSVAKAIRSATDDFTTPHQQLCQKLDRESAQ